MWQTLKRWASLYEPAVARTLVAAFLQILVVAGIGLGNLPEILDAVLAFVAIAATVLAGRSIRKAVDSPARSQVKEVVATNVGFHQGVAYERRRQEQTKGLS